MGYGFSIIGCKSNTVKSLLEILNKFPGYQNFGIYSSYKESMDHILKQVPHLVFLNIDRQFSEGNAFHFLNDLAQYMEYSPLFIAVSCNKDKAYEVIKSNFIDYILEPISEYEIRRCIMRIEKKQVSSNKNIICLKSYSDYRFIDLDEVMYLQADNNTTDFYLLNQGKVSGYKTLKHYEDLLPQNFLRIHNSYIVNTNFLFRINLGKSFLNLLGEKKDIPFSRSYKSQVENLKHLLFQSFKYQA